MIKNIRHTGIVVNDLEKSLWFYKEKMGFSVFKHSEESGDFIENILDLENLAVTTVKLALKNNQMIELLDFNTHKRDASESFINDIGPTHLAFTVSNLDKIYSDFSNDGICFLSKPEISKDGHVKVVFCKAPEGTYIELVELI
jgi:catechol 2,3-dioxygenase-like lactoylglutathione lyase family enzyme